MGRDPPLGSDKSVGEKTHRIGAERVGLIRKVEGGITNERDTLDLSDSFSLL